MSSKQESITPFEAAYFVENYMRTERSRLVERGPSRHVVSNDWKGFETWLSDPSRFDFPYVDVNKKQRKEPSASYGKKIPKIKHFLHQNYDGLFHDVYWNLHVHPQEDSW
jgi:hypothetical protein